MIAGLRLAVSLLTVLPVGPRYDDASPPTGTRTAMLWAPVVGLGLGAAGAGVMAGSDRVGHSSLLAAALGITTVVVLTRGLHLDGLADTADGLGSRRPAEGALAVMRSGDVGPFGVATLVLVLVLQIAGAAGAGPAAVVVAVATGRVAITWVCRRGVPAARPQGLGSLVASTVHPAVAAAVAVVAAGAALVVGPLGPAAVLGGVAAAEVAVRVCVRRLGGVTGDVLGACCELAVATSLVVLATG